MNGLKEVFNHKALVIKRVLAAAFLFALSANQLLLSQSSIGLQIGKSYSKFEVTESTVNNYEYSPAYDHEGYLITVVFSHAFNKYFSVKSGLGYVKRGAIVTRDNGIVGYDKFSLNYLRLPLTIGVLPLKYLTINGGLSTAYLTKAKSFFGKDGYFETTESYERFDVGWETGLTMTFRNFSVNGSYFQSLKPVRVDEKNFNRSLEFSIGYQFNLKKGG